MCVIVHQPAGSYLSKPTAEQMWNRNPDGGGFAYISDFGKIVIDKAMNFNTFWKKFEKARSENRDKDFLVHFRIATSGKVGMDNTHPFRIDEHTVMAHNGMLNHIVGRIDIKAERSDTREFIDKILPSLPETWLDNEVLRDMVADYVGASKLMFLTTNPKLEKSVYIINREMGTDKHNMWWSNTAHVPKPTPKVKSMYFTGQTPATYPSNKPKDAASTTSVPTSRTRIMQGKEKQTTKPSEDNIYQLPLPGVQTQSDSCESPKRRPTQEEIEEFWLKSEYADVLTYHTMPEDTDQPLEALKALRKEMGLDTDLVLDVLTGEFECAICFEEISDVNGDCGCWDLICIGCGSLAPYCVHDPEDAEFVKVKEAWKVYEEKHSESRSRSRGRL